MIERERLESWVGDWTVGRFEYPYKNPGELRADIRALLDREAALEFELRRGWALDHGCPFSALYADDGELQCAACHQDFKRRPLDDLRTFVLVQRAAATSR